MTQYFSRTSKSLVVRDGPPLFEKSSGFEVVNESVRISMYSPDGSRLAYATATSTVVLDAATGAVVTTLPIAANDLYFSPKATYLVTWVRPSRDPATNHFVPNLRAWNVASCAADGTAAKPVAQILQKSQGSFRGGWYMQFTADERFALIKTGDKILQIFDGGSLSSVASKLEIADGIEEFSVSGGKNPVVAVFVPSHKNKPASARVYKLPTASHPIAQRTFFKADTVKFLWNKLGTVLLVLASTDTDRSGQNYYGQSSLYLLSANQASSDQRIALDAEGPVHDVCWSPTSDEFGVVYGYMPSCTSFFDSRGRLQRQVPRDARNTIHYSPHGHYVLVGGFGNLQGAVDIYDRNNDMRKVTTALASHSSYLEWSPCGQYFLTATTSPRLRVDNGVKIWHYTGKLVYHHSDEELFTVSWRPEELPPRTAGEVCCEAHHSATNVKAPEPADKPKTAYRPPHARTAGAAPAMSQSLYARRLAATAAAPEMTPAQAKNSKRRAGGAAGAGAGANPAAGSASSASGNSTAAPVVSPEEKQLRALLKKRRAIEELKAKRDQGIKLETTQLQKIDTEAEVLAKLKALNWSEE